MKLFRGYSAPISEGIVVNPFLQSPRKPRHSNPVVHRLADDWFREQFGVAARSTTILCSTDHRQAATYVQNDGVLAEVTPVGAFKAIFSTAVKDFLQYAADGVPAERSAVRQWLGQQYYQCVSDLDAITPPFQGEVMLYCQEYQLRFAPA